MRRITIAATLVVSLAAAAALLAVDVSAIVPITNNQAMMTMCIARAGVVAVAAVVAIGRPR